MPKQLIIGAIVVILGLGGLYYAKTHGQGTPADTNVQTNGQATTAPAPQQPQDPYSNYDGPAHN